MYTTIRSDYIKLKIGLATKKTLRVDIVCDTEADLPEPKPEWTQGSTAWIVNDSKLKVLNGAGEWVGK